MKITVTACSPVQRILSRLVSNFCWQFVGAGTWNGEVRARVFFDVHFGVSFSGNTETYSSPIWFINVEVALRLVCGGGRGLAYPC